MKKLAYGCLLYICSCSIDVKNAKIPNVVYLDYAASYEISDSALEKFQEISKLYGNSSGINHHAQILQKIEKNASEIIANKINANPNGIVYTQNATIANNIAILGVAHKNPHCHLITSKIEHKSVYNTFKSLEKQGFDVTFLDADKHGNIDIIQLENSIKSNTKLISIQFLNSEVGSIQNIKKIGELAKKHSIVFHSDAAQAFCKYDIDVQKLNIDLLTISGYKIGTPKGIAALYVKNRNKLQPIFCGTGDPLHPGTQSTALIASFAEAVKSFKFDHEKIRSNFYTLAAEIQKIDNVTINTDTQKPSHIISVSIDGVLLDDVLNKLSAYSISSGCSCNKKGKSNVITAINKSSPSCTLRVSYADSVQSSELITFAAALKQAVEQLRREKPNIGKHCTSDKTDKKELRNIINDIEQNLKDS